MSCVDLTSEMTELIETLMRYPLPDNELNRLQQSPVFAMARRWGWVMASGELTGIGWAHAAGLRRDGPGHGILPR